MSLWRTSIFWSVGLLTLGGCFGKLTPASASVAGYKQPVLLGPVDRMGMTEARPVAKFGTYDAVSKAAYQESSSGGYRYEIHTRDETQPYTHAVRALAGRGEQAELRLSMVKARSFGYLFGLSNKVVLEADAVTVGGAK